MPFSNFKSNNKPDLPRRSESWEWDEDASVFDRAKDFEHHQWSYEYAYTLLKDRREELIEYYTAGVANHLSKKKNLKNTVKNNKELSATVGNWILNLHLRRCKLLYKPRAELLMLIAQKGTDRQSLKHSLSYLFRYTSASSTTIVDRAETLYDPDHRRGVLSTAQNEVVFLDLSCIYETDVLNDLVPFLNALSSNIFTNYRPVIVLATPLQYKYLRSVHATEVTV